MTLTIHRGTHEVGGSCVELAADKTRILIDFGMPLVDESGNDFNFNAYKNDSHEELIKKGILPDIKGLYGEDRQIDAILISHPHEDHFGLLSYVNKNIPIYLSEGTKRLIEIDAFFKGNKNYLKNAKVIKPWQEFYINEIKITPYLADHSGFDALAFLIEAGNMRIFYSGDFRGHGRKKKVFDEIIKNPPKNIDYLILEGTCIEKESNDNKTEVDIENELIEKFSNDKLTFISYSSQNIDRIISIYKACIKIKKIFVIDPYTAYVLDKIKDLGSIPQPKWNKNFRIFFVSDRNTRKIAYNNELYQFKYEKITEKEIKDNRENIIIRNSFNIRKKFEYLINPKDTQLVYSQWKGYLKNEKKFWDRHEITPDFIHSSGHAYVSELAEFAKALNPKKIIPIHTFAPDKFREYFRDKVLLLRDREKIEI